MNKGYMNNSMEEERVRQNIKRWADYVVRARSLEFNINVRFFNKTNVKSFVLD